jgi:hypothetical protein
MKTCWYTVIRVREAWWVDCEGKAYGPFEDMDEATKYARVIAETYGPHDRQSEVWAPDESGRPRRVWSGQVTPH